MKKRLALLFAVSLVLLLSACAGAADLDQPPEIRYGEDACDECNMIINEPRFAAAYYTADGTARRFDDIADMCAYHLAHEEEVARFWVHDYETEEWLRAEEATFVIGDDVYTPMASGVVAFGQAAAAERFASEVDGMVFSFDHLLEHLSEAEEGHHHEEHDSMEQHHDMDADGGAHSGPGGGE
jgi:copper chaperone NosL